MIEIVNEDGVKLDIDKDAKFPIERNNPLFNDPDKFFQDLTYPVKTKLTDNVKRFIRNGHLVEVSNGLYSIPVTLTADVLRFKGIMQYKVLNGTLDFTLKINLGALASKIKTTRLPEIRTFDAFITTVLTEAGWQSKLKDTCVNPQNYPYAFFPVRNEGLSFDEYESYKYTNYFDYASQTFFLRATAGDKDDGLNWNTYNTPFFKLTYIVKKVMEYLGLQATGTFFNEENEKLYIYNRYNVNPVTGGAAPVAANLIIWASMSYMPNITIAEFFKLIRLRFKASFAFDLKSSSVTIDTIEGILNSDTDLNIDKYIESISEIEMSKKTGYTVTLKPDESNSLFLKNGEYYPTNQMVVEDGAEKIEIDCGTLKKFERSPATNQSIGKTWRPQENNDYTTRNIWPLLLVKYDGMVQLEPGKYFPSASPFDLTEDDALYYQLMNSAKRVKIIANIPASAMAEIHNYNGKISFKSKEGAQTYALIDKLKYDLGAKQTVKATIEALTISSKKSIVRLEDLSNAGEDPITGNTIDMYKAYFDPQKHGISSVTPEYVIAGMTTTCDSLTISSDGGGVGGQMGKVTRISGTGSTTSYEVRIKEGKPRFTERFGIIHNFIQGPGYWYVTIPHSFSYGGNGSFQPLWIVF